MPTKLAAIIGTSQVGSMPVFWPLAGLWETEERREGSSLRAIWLHTNRELRTSRQQHPRPGKSGCAGFTIAKKFP